MSVDITMKIIHNDKIITDNIFEGRNSEWFDNLSSKCISNESYNYLPASKGVKESFPQEWKDLKKEYYYNFRYITVQDFIFWYNKYLPAFCGGWVHKYTNFLMKYKHHIPEDGVDLYHYLSEDDIIEDMIWVEYNNPYEPSTEIYKYLLDNDIPRDAYIVYCFDC